MKTKFIHSWPFKLFAILLLVGGLFFIVLSGINIYEVAKYNEALPPNSELKEYEGAYQFVAMALMLFGVYFFTLAFGKKKEKI